MKIDVSIGELVDKLSILAIKLQKISNPDKIVNIKKEYDILLKATQELGISLDSDEYLRLVEVNLQLWEIEDRIRIKESNKEFDAEFISLARSVYFRNDDRSDVKREINLRYNSELIEEKEYINYKKA